MLKKVLVPDALIDTRDLMVSAKLLRVVAEVKRPTSISELSKLASISRSAVCRDATQCPYQSGVAQV